MNLAGDDMLGSDSPLEGARGEVLKMPGQQLLTPVRAIVETCLTPTPACGAHHALMRDTPTSTVQRFPSFLCARRGLANRRPRGFAAPLASPATVSSPP